MKKKILALALVVAMLAIAVVSGSLAWFTDDDKIDNTFTVGSIEIKQHEKGKDGKDFVQGQAFLPIVKKDRPHEDKNYIPKIVTVENTGKNDAYIRTHIAVPRQLKDYLHLDVNTGRNSDWDLEYTSTATYQGVAYVVYTYYYDAVLESKDFSQRLLNGVYMDSKVDIKENNGKDEFCMPDGKGGFVFSGFAVEDATKVHVLVVTQAVQADGFRNAEDALNSAFGRNNNPIS